MSAGACCADRVQISVELPIVGGVLPAAPPAGMQLAQLIQLSGKRPAKRLVANLRVVVKAAIDTERIYRQQPRHEITVR